MEDNKILGILVACFVASLIITLVIVGGMIKGIEVKAQPVDLSGVVTAEQVNAIVGNQVGAVVTAVQGITIPAPVSTTTTIINGTAVTTSNDYSGEYVLTKAEFEDEAIEDEALRLAIESVGSRDFKKAVFEALVDFGVDIESYKDITEITNVEDAEIKNNNKVEFDLKVYYFIEGDDDEEYKTRLDEFKVKVNDLDFDEDFDDAEVNEDYMDSLIVKYSREL